MGGWMGGWMDGWVDGWMDGHAAVVCGPVPTSPDCPAVGIGRSVGRQVGR